MKMVMLMYLEEDERCAAQLLDKFAVASFTRIPVEGHGPGGSSGWYGSTSPYRSQLTFTFVEDEVASELVAAVSSCSGVADPGHPIRAAIFDVEEFVTAETLNTGEET